MEIKTDAKKKKKRRGKNEKKEAGGGQALLQVTIWDERVSVCFVALFVIL